MPRTSPDQLSGPLAARVSAVGNRRGFFAKSSIAIAGGTVLAVDQAVSQPKIPPTPHISGGDTIRVGLIGCGARGKAAAMEALQTNQFVPGARVEIVAMADAMNNQVQSAYRAINGRFSQYCQARDRRFSGMNAWRNVIDCDADLIILATPPVFRPAMFAAAVDAGKHVMLESQIAIDPSGIDRFRASAETAASQRLVVASGLYQRHEQRIIETIQRLHQGAIGEVRSASFVAQPRTSVLPERSSSMSRREYELRNWGHFEWTGGDRFDHRYLHSIDLINWAIGHPPIASVVETPDRLESRSLATSRLLYPNSITATIRGETTATRSHRCGEQLVGTQGECDLQRGIVRDLAGKTIWKSEAKEIRGKGWQSQFNAMITAIQTGNRFDESGLAIQSTQSVLVAQNAVRDSLTTTA